MKKIYSFIMLIVALMTTTTANAGGGGNTTTYYARFTATVAGTGEGKVYVSTDGKDDESKYTSPSFVKDVNTTNPDNDYQFYAFAKPEFGSEFVGWYDNANGEGDARGTNDWIKYGINAGSTSQNNPTAMTMYAIFKKVPNTLLMQVDYKISGVVSLAEGVNESMVPAAFKKYLENEGNYEAFASIEGDEELLTITNNTEGGILNGFTIKGDAVKFSPDDSFKLNDKAFTIVKAEDTEKTSGTLKITKKEDESYALEDLAVVYGSHGVIGYVKNIVITYDENHTAADMITADSNNKKADIKKFVKNGKLFIKNNGKVYNAAGAVTE